MGFHLVERVYANVTGTSPTAQAVLAYLAHKADDQGVRKCFPSIDAIHAATHFGRSTINAALNDLCEAKLLTWVRGGRLKGHGGRSLANEYTFHLPTKPAASSVHQSDGAASTSRTVHSPPAGHCIVHQPDTINQDQPQSQPSVTPRADAEAEVLKLAFEKEADAWIESWAEKRQKFAADREFHERMRHEVVNEAMKVCGVDDFENRRIFSSTLVRRDPDMALEVIWRFGSEFRAGEHKKLRCPAAQLNKLLSLLPVIN